MEKSELIIESFYFFNLYVCEFVCEREREFVNKCIHVQRERRNEKGNYELILV